MKNREAKIYVEYGIMLGIALILILLLDSIPYGKVPGDFPLMPPHQFYGVVNCSSSAKVVPSTIVLTATTLHATVTENYTLNTTTNLYNNTYGFFPNLFFADGIADSDNITFYAQNEKVYSTLFASSEIYEKNLTLATTCVDANICGNSVCESGESCSSCSVDCSQCPPGNPPGNPPPDNIINQTINISAAPGTSLQTNQELRNVVSGIFGSSLTDQRIASFMDNSNIISSRISIRSDIYSNATYSVLTIRLRNNAGRQMQNFVVYERVPKTFSQNSTSLTTVAVGSSYGIVRTDPEYVFAYDTLDDQEEVVISHRKNSNSVASILASLYFEVYSENINQVSCTEDETRCNNNDIETCIDGEWSVTEPCQYGCNAQDVSCEVSFSGCNNGENRCSDNNFQVCSGNAWVTEETCTNGCAVNGCVTEEKDYTVVFASIIALAVLVCVYVVSKKLRKESPEDMILQKLREEKL